MTRSANARTVAAMNINTTYRKSAVALLACGACVLGVAACGSSDEPAKPRDPGPLVLDVVFDAESSKQVDTGAKGESLGDYLVGAADLKRRGKSYGRLSLIDYVLDNRYEGSMKIGTMILPRGTLSLQGGGVNVPVPGTPRHGREQLAVVGGTGAYERAAGSVTILPVPDGDGRLSIQLRD